HTESRPRASAGCTSADPSSPVIIAQRLLKAHERLVGSPLYLASPSLRENVTWQRQGRADILVHEELDAILSEPTPAVLSTVFQITSDDFFLTSDGGYRGPTRFHPSLAEVKPTCTGTIPPLDPFRTDFARALDNLRWLQDQIATPTFHLKRGVLVERPHQSPKLKVCHVLFEVNTCSDSASQPTLPPEWSLDHWPVSSDAARAELAAIKDAGQLDIVPLPAYNVEGNLIRPQDYRTALMGAIVEVHFTLTHWTISARASEEPADVYVADIQYMRVLVPP
ncbi:hypothetical protein C8Q77DRAFT_1036223, partial [Trametes polyzona]